MITWRAQRLSRKRVTSAPFASPVAEVAVFVAKVQLSTPTQLCDMIHLLKSNRRALGSADTDGRFVTILGTSSGPNCSFQLLL